MTLNDFYVMSFYAGAIGGLFLYTSDWAISRRNRRKIRRERRVKRNKKMSRWLKWET